MTDRSTKTGPFKEWVQERLQEVTTSRCTTLRLDHMMLQELPDDIREMGWLEAISLSNNLFRELPTWLDELPKLRRIEAFRNPQLAKLSTRYEYALDWNTWQANPQLNETDIVGLRFDSSVRFPDQVGSMQHLELLDLSGTKGEPTRPMEDTMHLIAQAVKNFPKLKSLKVIGCELTTLPDAAGEFRELEDLFLHMNPMGTIPDCISGLSTLQRLFLDDMGIKELPDWLWTLPELRVLSLRYNDLELLPESVCNAPRLEALYLRHNRLTNLPETIKGCGFLTKLYVGNNPFAGFPLPLPPTLQELSLPVTGRSVMYLGTGLDVSGVKSQTGTITTIPPEILDLPNLSTLDVKNQPITTPPPEVVARGLDAIRDYWRQRKHSGTDHLCESKLIIVGEPGAGKTTLVRKILDPGYCLEAGLPSTEGIDVAHWSFATLLRPHTPGLAPEQRDYDVNIWDFGGQEIYHATHQFFLTRRSLYVLLVDDRKEDTDLHYWLSVIELLGGCSPVLIVRNEKQDRRRELDAASLRQRFASLREVAATNLATNRGLEDVIGLIRRYLEALPHIGEPLPKTWRSVREAIENDSRDYISHDTYLDLAREHGFTNGQDSLLLSGYLHDLGICLHFQDDPVLKHTVILRPTWGTDAVYRVLDDSQVIGNHGLFTRCDITRIWSEPTYQGKQQELLHLMMRFQLCYKLPERDAWIAPQLLQVSPPQYAWPPKHDLYLRYEYTFMPKGIMTRLIVALHEFIEGGDSVWRSGAVFTYGSARCEVVENYPERRISIRAHRAGRRPLLAIVHHELEKIHRSFKQLKYKVLLPCTCSTCGDGSPHTYPLEILQRFARDRREIQCQHSYQMMNAHALIEGMFEVPVESSGPSPVPRREAYVSFAWGANTEIVDSLQSALKNHKINVLRDRDELAYRDSIQKFMDRLGRGSAVIIVLSRAYLRSKSCMYELVKIHTEGALRERAYPIVLDDSGIHDPKTVLDHIAYWENEINELDSKMKSVEQSNLHGIREELDLYRKIRELLPRLTTILKDMNHRTPAGHQASGFTELASQINEHLKRVL